MTQVEVLDKLAGQAYDMHYAVHIYPRLKKVAINGGRLQNYPEAIKRLKEMVKSET